MPGDIANEIDALQQMTTSELAERYQQLHGQPVRTPRDRGHRGGALIKSLERSGAAGRTALALRRLVQRSVLFCGAWDSLGAGYRVRVAL